uniref:Putative disease resistance RPP13-like protein 1 n=1 Tax=Populus alba TaxID=43335 RepID=A0A4U5LSD6_POPAL|nr:putative disease resistance RPP13-like protein 1 [Populus alba]
MALVIGDAILSATISHIIDQLSSLELLKLARRGKIHSDIKKLEANLHMIHAVLDDAEEKQMESHAVKVWLDQIRELAYDIEDLLDGVFTDLKEEQRASSSKAKSAIPGFLSSFYPGNFLLTYKTDTKIKRITARLQEIAQKKNNLELRENGSGGVLKNSDEKLPVHSELKLEECDEVTPKCIFYNSSLITLKLGSMSRLTCLRGQFLHSLGALKVLMISDFPELTCLWQKGTELENFEHPQFVSSTEIGMPSTHKSSKLSGCGKLDLLPIHRVHMLLSLEYLCIESCPNLVSIPEAGLLSSLRHLVLRDCKALGSLPDGMSSCPLECLEIEECPSLKCFPGGMLPPTLKGLKIRYCTELKSLPEGLMHNKNGSGTLCHFEHLEIIGCPSLKSFPDGKLPTRLKTLKIWDCSQLMPPSEMMLHDDMSLEYLAISDCEVLSSFPECLGSFKHLSELNLSNCSALKHFPGDGFSLANLRTLAIYNCKNLKSLPKAMRKLTSLQELTICSCPALNSFPKGDMPPNLTSLEIWDCDSLDGCLSEWNLQSLAFLRDFSIAGGCFSGTVSFPDEKCLLPTSLTSVWIGRLPNLESLSMQLQSLANLEELEIVDCPKLKSLPRGCLPHALGRFSIRDCPLMTQRCSKEKGVYWPLISHIPCVEIDDGHDM